MPAAVVVAAFQTSTNLTTQGVGEGGSVPTLVATRRRSSWPQSTTSPRTTPPWPHYIFMTPNGHKLTKQNTMHDHTQGE